MNNPRASLGTLVLIGFLLTGIAADMEHLDSIFLRLYLGRTIDVYMDQRLENANVFVPKMESNKPTVLYIHGFTESLESTSVHTVVSAYLERQDHNVLAVDYRQIANESYVRVTISASDVATALAAAINDMVEAGLDQERIHVVGHSMGAQVAGYIGRKLAFQLSRITGLDPAGPLFNFLETHLSSSDASFVDVIHTDYGFYGVARKTGSVDFFPNGGRRVQPGCPKNPTFFSPEDFCSHHRSWRFYAESLSDETAFLSVPCQSQLQFVFGDCAKNQVIPMGFATPSDASGSYFLVTSGESPFGLKEQGTKYRATRRDVPLLR